MSQELSAGAQKAVEKAEKLMRLAGGKTTPEEAASATAKAMELLAVYNLDLTIIEQGGGEKSKRSDEKMKGGLYNYQRELWSNVAILNFCMYWTQRKWDPDKKSAYWSRKLGSGRAERGGYTFQHRVVGRTLNIISTRNMAQYLEQTVERLVRERLAGQPGEWYTRWANSFREGVTDEIVRKLVNRRHEMLTEEKRQHMETEARAKTSQMDGASSGTALTLSTLRKSEEDANTDFLYGDGTSAKWAADRARMAEANRNAEAEYTKWAAAHPKEASQEEAARRKERRGRAPRSEPEKKIDYGAYQAGREKGKHVSIDQQVGDRTAGRLK